MTDPRIRLMRKNSFIALGVGAKIDAVAGVIVEVIEKEYGRRMGRDELLVPNGIGVHIMNRIIKGVLKDDRLAFGTKLSVSLDDNSEATILNATPNILATSIVYYLCHTKFLRQANPLQSAA